MSWLRKTTLTLLALGTVTGTASYAGEVSMVSGLYKSENNKSDGEKTVGKSTIEVGARYAEVFQDNLSWFGQGMLSLRTFSGDNAPSNSTNLMLRGGMRMYFNQYSETLIPFLSGSAGYVSEKDVDGNNEVETSGLFYWGDVGLRMEVGQSYFFEVETNLFESALFATTKTKPIDDGDPATDPADSEQTRIELYVNTKGAFNTTYVAVGMRL